MSDNSELEKLVSSTDDILYSHDIQNLNSTGDSILAIDPEQPKGLLCKSFASMYSFNLDKGFEYLTKAVTNMSSEEFMKMREKIVSTIAFCICNLSFDDGNEIGDTVDLISAVWDKDTDEECCFPIAVQEAVQSQIGTILPENIVPAYMQYVEFSYGNILVSLNPYLMLGSTIAVFEFITSMKSMSKMKNLMYGKNVDLMDSVDAMYYPLSDGLTERLNSLSEEDVDKIINYWAEQEDAPYLDHFFKARGLCSDLINAGFLKKRKIKKEIELEINNYLNKFFVV